MASARGALARIPSCDNGAVPSQPRFLPTSCTLQEVWQNSVFVARQAAGQLPSYMEPLLGAMIQAHSSPQ
eukprot:2410942-Amphidinium_carterae.1